MKIFNKSSTDITTDIWDKYQKGVDWHNKNSIYTDTEQYYNFFQGDQWNGIDTGGEQLPMHNFITPTVEYKVAMIAMSLVSINYSSQNRGEKHKIFQDACDKLNQSAAIWWEQQKMDTKRWNILRQKCVSGDAYLYFYNANADSQIIDRTNIYLSDEQNNDIQKQKYIIIYERRFVDDIKEEAKTNGIPDDEIEMIVGDDDTDTLPENVRGNEVSGTKKCSCLLYMTKKNGNVVFARSTKTVVYQPETEVEGLTMYPIVNSLWNEKRGSARGIGIVQMLINNQIESNKLLARRSINIKMTGFPKPVINTQMFSNPTDVDKVGATMKMNGSISSIKDAFGYVAPSYVSNDAKVMQDELIENSRNFANAGDNATGNINPTRTSAAAITAVRDQQSLASTQAQATDRQFIEDIAIVLLNIWTAYNPNGLTVDVMGTDGITQEVIPAEILTELSAQARIDISPVNPYSKLTQIQFIDNLIANQTLFENTQMLQEYHDMLPEDGSIPKDKLQEIIDRRNTTMQDQKTSQLDQATSMIDQQQQMIQQLQGGGNNEMSTVQ